MSDNHNHWSEMTNAERWGRLGATVENIQGDVREIKAFNVALGAKVDTNEKRIAEIMTRCKERARYYDDRTGERRLNKKLWVAIGLGIVANIVAAICATAEIVF